jgi:retron-type reverse transcriptase
MRIPKPDGPLRPLGIASQEDKIVQQAKPCDLRFTMVNSGG